MESAIRTMGDTGLFSDGNKLVIGQKPKITQHEKADGSHEPIIDMQPTLIGISDVLQLLIMQNEVGRPTDFLGHVRVLPTDRNTRISLTDDGNVELESQES